MQGWQLLDRMSFSLFVVSIMPWLALDFSLVRDEKVDSGACCFILYCVIFFVDSIGSNRRSPLSVWKGGSCMYKGWVLKAFSSPNSAYARCGGLFERPHL